ncbi:F-type H+-transporting ATPase subunit b [Methylomagnum ishizawai]|uniref:ATP synthase subunit b n=1 Tax=Methylomagnum ishizawai TaxID=1760988 RepID=A0A1Y6CZW3_9GAMM|nr:F0F1 ATP synthase subunit delta [Methylomagnum ishizawai]SMF95881.1 F-type H+-transporting ATPase subunit b [Methylomagnum ishizawai]
MNFDWTTFALEFLNFLILLWLLRRFLYQPVLEVIAARQRKIEDQLHDAERSRAEAQTAREACEHQQAAWADEQLQARAELAKSIAAERERLLRGVADEVAEARAKFQAQEERERQDWARATEQRALALGGRFVAKLLERAAGPELEARLVNWALADLAESPAGQAETLRAALAGDGPEVVSAFPLADGQRAAISAALAQLAGQPIQVTFREDAEVLAGLRIHAGAWVLAANLRDELQFFQAAGESEHGPD